MLSDLIRRLQRNNKMRSLRRHPRLFALLFLGTIPPIEIVRRPHLIRLILAVKSNSMLTYPRLLNLFELAVGLARDRTPGNIVQFGVWKGGSAGLLGKLVEDDPSRDLWLFDSWEGTPQPTPEDVADSGELGRLGMFPARQEAVEALLFRRLHLDAGRVHLVKGWFRDTLPRLKDALGEIALLHIDSDFYESVRLCLQETYSHVVPGGAVVVDDYGDWTGCRRAIDEFLAGLESRPALVPIDGSAVYWRKPASARS